MYDFKQQTRFRVDIWISLQKPPEHRFEGLIMVKQSLSKSVAFLLPSFQFNFF
jgi:hypothetical protein